MTFDSRKNRHAIYMMVGAMACFVVNDALVKLVSAALPAAQLVFLRGLMASALVLGVAFALGAQRRLGAMLQPRVAARAVVDAVGTFMYLLSLFHLPLANATAINLSVPLFMIVFAVWFLRERPGAARWTAVALGFVGVLAVVQPRGDGFNAWALLCLAGTLVHAGRDLMTRGIAPTTPSIVVTAATALAITLFTGAIVAVQGWQPVGLRELLLLGAAASFLASAYFLLIQCMRQGDVSLTAPFRYSGVLLAVPLGYWLWGDVPNAWAWAGIALLVGAGLYVVRSERRRAVVPAAATQRA